MMQTATYLAVRDIAVRSGMINYRYRIADGRFVLNDRDLARVPFTPDEYISGLEGVVKVTEAEAETLIRQNGYTMGDNPVESEENGESGLTTDQEEETPTESKETQTIEEEKSDE